MSSLPLPSVDALSAAGRDKQTPAAAIAHGTTAAQRTVITTLSTLCADVRAAGLQAPVLVVVGQVVSLHEQLAPSDQAQPVVQRAALHTRR